jgi:RNA polymerase-binding transcription factor DksA
MKEGIYGLIAELRTLARAQMEAVREDQVELLFGLQEQRRELLEKIQKFDISPETGILFDGEEEESSGGGEDISPSLKDMVLEIIEMDREIKERIRSEMNGILGRLNRLEQMKKGFCQTGARERNGKNLCLNA